MRELYFVSPYRRSIRTIHLQYDFAGKNCFAGKKFILKITSGDKRTCRGVYMRNTLVFTPLFLEGFRNRISQNFKNELFRNQLEI